MQILFPLRFNFSPLVHGKSVSFPTQQSSCPKCFNRIWQRETKLDMPLNYNICCRVTKSGYQVSVQDESQVWKKDNEAFDFDVVSEIDIHIDYIRKLLGSMDDGRISVSPYDTAFVCLIKDLGGRNAPQFPSSLEWIVTNQLSDGSWGDEHFYLAYDRLLNTLACVVALRSWNVHADKSEKGILYIKENLRELENANSEEMTCGFELIFPALLQRARDLGIQGIPYDAPILKEISAARARKLTRVPKDLLHKVPTCLLHNLEGLEDLEWEKILKLQTPKGTFITSPSATAFAVMETKNEDCLNFIKYVAEKFNGGAPAVYPVDLYARLWAVDRLKRLGISRFFKTEIKNCLDYIYRFWEEKGIFSARESDFCDIDDTSMGFRLLRLHGYNVTPNVFENFKKDKKFMCYSGQAFESPSPLFNLYRASQVLFPGEKILEEAREFTYTFLQQRLASNQLLDKWLISKHLTHEIKTGLDIPWYASLPRIEARFYIENYGVDDVWIGKSLYRMPEINDNAYMELAKLDYNMCQSRHQMDWNHMQQWYDDCNIQEFGISKRQLLLAYFLAMASIFEPERSQERFAFVKSHIISNMISSYFNKEVTSSEQRLELLAEFTNSISSMRISRYHSIPHRLITILTESLHQISTDTLELIGRDVSDQLYDVWRKFFMNLNEGLFESQEIELIETQSELEYENLCKLINKICQQLHDREYQSKKVQEIDSCDIKKSKIEYMEIEKDMQYLLQLVLQKSDVINMDLKKTFLMVAKAFYYRAYFTMEIIDFHISKVLFEQVV